MSKQNAKRNAKKTVSINFEMNTECNNLLTRSKAKTKRTKRDEASLRLLDHLKRFPLQVWETKE